ncbi:MAG: DUF4097 family beta strand repeat protein [Lachnospiraceae bacterium]|nr:DUF4097 family beta strand repeat protein [Lachnospiraceae bacterium]MBO7363661.1 DUF4097 family beta strand repeat protein [Lachnospiraceae bacterium]MBP5555069.1 DUF4097 family beta strand repeat protein [Lachnospiraceae bacterium]MBP5761533.1 DUF4097 family beta strand repeat protein [Lachnospiraceae bacterium]
MTTASKIIITILSIVTVLVIFFALIFRGFRSLVFNFSGSYKLVENCKELEGTPSEINIDASFTEASIVYGSEFSVEYAMPDALEPTVSFKDGTLTVKSGRNNATIPMNVTDDLFIRITVPAGTELEKLHVNINAGSLDISDIKADTVTIDMDAGDLDIDGIEAGKIEIDCDAGNVEARSCTADLFVLDLDAGNADFSDCEIETIEADVDAGNFEARNCTINGGTCNTSLGNIYLSGNIGNVKTDADLGNVEVH